MNKTAIIVAGPTAAGKTGLAIDLALRFQTEIISADSRQCYRELTIGTAKPSPQQLAAVPHHFIDSHSVTSEVTAADFERYALEKAAELFETRDTVVVAGGTGLYLRAFCTGLDEMPAVDPAVRESVRAQYESEGLPWLRAAVAKEDPAFYASGEIKNPQRLQRALELVRTTGRSITEYRKNEAKPRPFAIRQYGVEIDRETLGRRIDARVDAMMTEGLLDEVKRLVPYRGLGALRTVGYAELFDHLDGKMTLGEAVAAIRTHTRQYAKRQMTWFRRDTAISWLAPAAFAEIQP